ncbi:MAG: hypothetical protein IE881_08895 [Epsilonproteobacteria bacterium]|nr:hypothetical protein [Campylobacterota bacterium]
MVSVLKEDMRAYINLYNHKRFHETLNDKKAMEGYYENIKMNETNYTHNILCVA